MDSLVDADLQCIKKISAHDYISQIVQPGEMSTLSPDFEKK